MVPVLDIEKGTLALEIGGKVRTLAFNVKASFHLALASESKEDAGLSQSALFLWAGLLSNRKKNELPDDFNLQMAFDWMMGLDGDEIELVLAFGGKCLGFHSDRTAKLVSDENTQNSVLEKYLKAD